MKIAVIIETIIIMIGVILIYDARFIARKFFGLNDQNSASFMLKLLGFVISAVCGVLILL